jgi:hypothetical protein
MPFGNFQKLLKQNRRSLLRKPSQPNSDVQRRIRAQQAGRTPLNNFALRAIRQRQAKQAQDEQRQRANERIQALRDRSANLPETSNLAVRFDAEAVIPGSGGGFPVNSQPTVTNSPTDLRPTPLGDPGVSTQDSTLDATLADDDLFSRRRPDLPF